MHHHKYSWKWHFQLPAAICSTKLLLQVCHCLQVSWLGAHYMLCVHRTLREFYGPLYIKHTFPAGPESSPPWAVCIKCQFTIHICLSSACVTDTNVVTKLPFWDLQLQIEHRCYSRAAKCNTDAVRVWLPAKRSNHMPQCVLYPSKRPSPCSAKQRRELGRSTGGSKRFSRKWLKIAIKIQRKKKCKMRFNS